MRRQQAIFLALLCILLFRQQVEGSVIFPSARLTDSQRKRPSWIEKSRDARKQQQQRARSSLYSARTVARKVTKGGSSPAIVPSGMPLAFFDARQGGWFLVAAAALGYLNKKLRSEAVGRALYFWTHAGPIVAHYKFTRWSLRRTKAPLEKRDQVYNALHDKYCQQSIDIVLHLKGKFIQEKHWKTRI
jgi:hypothetical protein